MYFKPQNTLRQIIGSPKDKLDPLDTCGPIYLIQCEGTTECHHSYVEETECSLRARVAEHLKPSSVNSKVSRHVNKDFPSHQVHVKEVGILSRENHWFERGIKEAIHIRTHQPELNRALPTSSYLGQFANTKNCENHQQRDNSLTCL